MNGTGAGKDPGCLRKQDRPSGELFVLPGKAGQESCPCIRRPLQIHVPPMHVVPEAAALQHPALHKPRAGVPQPGSPREATDGRSCSSFPGAKVPASVETGLQGRVRPGPWRRLRERSPGWHAPDVPGAERPPASGQTRLWVCPCRCLLTCPPALPTCLRQVTWAGTFLGGGDLLLLLPGSHLCRSRD